MVSPTYSDKVADSLMERSEHGLVPFLNLLSLWIRNPSASRQRDSCTDPERTVFTSYSGERGKKGAVSIHLACGSYLLLSLSFI